MTHLTKKIGSGICMIALLMGIVCPAFAGQDAPAKPAATTSSKPAATTETGSGISMAGTLSVVSDIGALASASAPVVGVVSGMAGADSSISSALSMGGEIASGASSLAEGASNISLGSAMSVAGSALSIAGVKGATSTALQMGGALGSALVGSAKDGMGSIVDNLNLESAKNFGLSIIEDIAPEIKQLMGLKLDDIVSTFSNLTSLSGLKHAYTVIMPDMEVQSGINTASAVAHGVAADQQYNSETAITATEGQAGNIDFRYTGECKIDGYDYGAVINDYIRTDAIKNEGLIQHLYLDTECWVTVGIGSVLFEYSSPGNEEGYKNYFKKFEYVDRNGNPLSEEIQMADLHKRFNDESRCRAETKKSHWITVIDKKTGKEKKIWNHRLRQWGKNWRSDSALWKQDMHGEVTEKSAVTAIFTELCDHHLRYWVPSFAKLGVPFSNLPRPFQKVMLDISYQAGKDRIGTDSTMKRAVVRGQCSVAHNAFMSTGLCSQYPDRCESRKSRFKEPCGGR